MIKSKQDLQKYLNLEKNIYKSGTVKADLYDAIFKTPKYYKWAFIKNLRKLEYYKNNRSPLNNILYHLYLYSHYRLQRILGMELPEDVFGEGLVIHHTFGIVVNGDCKIGKNCILHGSNVIGNRGHNYKCPELGDNVRLGVGAKVLGDVYIADDVKIAAGAVVINSCYIKGALLTGVPAKVHSSK